MGFKYAVNYRPICEWAPPYVDLECICFDLTGLQGRLVKDVPVHGHLYQSKYYGLLSTP